MRRYDLLMEASARVLHFMVLRWVFDRLRQHGMAGLMRRRPRDRRVLTASLRHCARGDVGLVLLWLTACARLHEVGLHRGAARPLSRQTHRRRRHDPLIGIIPTQAKGVPRDPAAMARTQAPQGGVPARSGGDSRGLDVQLNSGWVSAESRPILATSLKHASLPRTRRLETSKSHLRALATSRCARTAAGRAAGAPRRRPVALNVKSHEVCCDQPPMNSCLPREKQIAV
jgi:hypothetical protein